VAVLGNEFAGEVEEVGGAVTSFEVGDRVFGYNDRTFGGHAEYMAIPEGGLLAAMPANCRTSYFPPRRGPRRTPARPG
jgi:NADPH:quinone reductase-like Zn-dependent oxidoreductase